MFLDILLVKQFYRMTHILEGIGCWIFSPTGLFKANWLLYKHRSIPFPDLQFWWIFSENFVRILEENEEVRDGISIGRPDLHPLCNVWKSLDPVDQVGQSGILPQHIRLDVVPGPGEEVEVEVGPGEVIASKPLASIVLQPLLQFALKIEGNKNVMWKCSNLLEHRDMSPWSSQSKASSCLEC